MSYIVPPSTGTSAPPPGGTIDAASGATINMPAAGARFATPGPYTPKHLSGESAPPSVAGVSGAHFGSAGYSAQHTSTGSVAVTSGQQFLRNAPLPPSQTTPTTQMPTPSFGSQALTRFAATKTGTSLGFLADHYLSTHGVYNPFVGEKYQGYLKGSAKSNLQSYEINADPEHPVHDQAP